MSDLSENIRKYRKANNLTQEALADKLGVKFGVISKWENGISEPDIGYVMALADVFHISVDALIGHVMRGKNASAVISRIQKLVQNRELDKAKTEVDSALKLFPNDLGVVYTCGKTYVALWSVNKDKKAMKNALECFEHSLNLLPGDDDSLNEMVIGRDIATCYLYLDEPQKSLDYLKRNNSFGINDVNIAYLLTTKFKNYKEAEKYAGYAYLNNLFLLLNVFATYILMYLETNPAQCIKVCDLTEDCLMLFKEDKTEVSAFEKYIPYAKLAKSICLIRMKAVAEGTDLIREAYSIARKFDENPVYNMSNIILAQNMKDYPIYDAIEESAVAALDSLLLESVKPKEKTYVIWKEIRKEAR